MIFLSNKKYKIKNFKKKNNFQIIDFFFITVKPLTINITNTSLLLVADHKYSVFCESTGSRPNALIVWYKGKKQLKKSKVNYYNPLYKKQNIFFFIRLKLV